MNLHDINPKGDYMWQQWVNFLAGIWLIVAAFIDFSSGGMQTNLIITGIVVAILAAWGAMGASESMSRVTR